MSGYSTISLKITMENLNKMRKQMKHCLPPRPEFFSKPSDVLSVSQLESQIKEYIQTPEETETKPKDVLTFL